MSDKAIYKPRGKALEYAEYACNFYVGCSNECTYCYLKKGIGKATLGGNKPTLKKCFKNETDALEVFEKELKANLPELQKHGLFFTFTSDPMLPETIDLTLNAAGNAVHYGVPVKILTKCADWVCGFCGWIEKSNRDNAEREWRNMYAFGFTLTGHDELEPNASTNAERIQAMKDLHHCGFKTFASIEPVIDTIDSFQVICDTNGFCDLYKIGLLSGKKYDRNELQLFVEGVINQVEFYGAKIYFKDSILNAINWNRDDLKKFQCCVDRDN